MNPLWGNGALKESFRLLFWCIYGEDECVLGVFGVYFDVPLLELVLK